MNRRTALILLLVLATMSGCGPKSAGPWQISAENQSDTPCSIFISLGTGSNKTARVDSLAKGPAQVLIAEPGSVLVRTVQVTRGAEVQNLDPSIELTPGAHLKVIVAPDGLATVALEL